MALKDDLQPLLRKLIRKYQVPGASVGVLRRGRMYASASAGVTNLDTQVPVTGDTVFQIGSITKPHTTTLVMQLVDEGLVDLDEPVKTYLPGFRVADLEVSAEVTPRQFLSHQSGIDGDFFVDSGRGDDSVERLVDMATMVPCLYPPGEKLSYCNLGFAVLGRVIEVVTRKSWDTVLKERLFDPLGMDHAFSLPEMALRYRCAIGHVPSRKPGVWNVSNIPYLSYGQKAAGSTPSMTATDLLKFARMHLDGGKNSEGKRIVSARSVRAMQRQQIRAPKHLPGNIRGWGLGWMLFDWDGHRLYGHDGGTIGQASYLRILPEKELAVALLTNGGDGIGLYQSLFGEIFHSLGRVSVPPLPTRNDAVSVNIDSLAGRYRNMNQTLTMKRSGDTLQVSVESNGPGAALFPDASPLGFVDRNTALLNTGNEMLDRLTFIFSGHTDGVPGFVSMGLRQYARVS